MEEKTIIVCFELFECEHCNKLFYSFNRQEKCPHCNNICDDDVIGNGEDKVIEVKIRLNRMTGELII